MVGLQADIARSLNQLIDDRKWKPMETAPKDGAKVWGWLDNGSIVLMHWNGHIGSWDTFAPDICEPRFWKRFDAIGIPPGVSLVDGRWRTDHD